jgi:hypothetical protein
MQFRVAAGTERDQVFGCVFAEITASADVVHL